MILSGDHVEIKAIFSPTKYFLFSGSVGKIIIIVFLSFRVSTLKIKNDDHRVKRTCATDSRQVTYETDNIYLLRDSTMSNALKFFFLYFILI